MLHPFTVCVALFLSVTLLAVPVTAAVNIPDAALKAKINSTLGKAADADITAAEMESLSTLELDSAPDIADITGLETATNLTLLYLSKTDVTDLSPIAGLTSLETLYLNNTDVADISAVSELTSLEDLRFNKTAVTEIAAVSGLTNLVSLRLHTTDVTDISAVSGLTSLDVLFIHNTDVEDLAPGLNLNLSDFRYQNTPALARPAQLTLVSGDEQSGDIGAALPAPFTVEVRNQVDTVLSDVSVSFSITAGNGSVSASPVSTDADGQAETTLTLGTTAGQNTVEASVAEITDPVTFTATAIRTPTTLVRVSGDEQSGETGSVLSAPFVVAVQDQLGTAMPDVPVSFAVTTGGGSVSATTVSTDSTGHAETTLTLGTTAGENAVEASTAGLTTTFTATATAPAPEPAPVPTTLEKISGDLQSLEPDDISAPLVVAVKDADGSPLEGITVNWDLQAGEGPLSDTQTTTGSNGQTAVTVTMGSRGRHTVIASVANIETTLTFYSYAQGAPVSIEVYSGTLFRSGDDQMVPVGKYPLSDLKARVTDVSGGSVMGVRVDWEVRSGGGNLRENDGYNTWSTTDGMGIAAKSVRVGTNPGINTYAATVDGVDGEALFTLEGMTGQVPQWLFVQSGNNQEAYTGKRLWSELGVYVKDYHNEYIGAGQTVYWAVIEGDATLDHETTETIGYGFTLNTITFGNTPGTIKVQAYIPRVYHSALFTLTALPRFPADVNFDGVVDVRDLLVVSNALGETEDLGVKDLDADGEITLADIRAVLEALEALVAEGETVTFEVVVPGAPTADGLPNLQHWTAEAVTANLAAGNLYARGVAVLQSLLEQHTVPEKTALLRNYPNPFNPETWIPYQLAKAAEVSVSIYDTQGAVVRTLTLGHQAVGVYQHRTRAAYWDGKNAQGEPVASGVYFYTLTAGDFTATQKMVIRK